VTGTIGFSPLLDPTWIVLLGLLAGAIALPGLLARRPGAVLRMLACAAALLALAGPEWLTEKKSPLASVALLVTDRSASQRLPGREAETETARKALAERIAALPDLELREAVFDDRGDVDADGTRLFDLVAKSLTDVPPDRVAGVVLLTDGQVHDVPAKAAALGFSAPVHALISGRKDEIDRRVELIEAPRFGLVGKTATFVFRVVDAPKAAAAPVGVTVRRDGEIVARRTVRVGDRVSLAVAIPHAGDVAVEIEADPLPGDLTPLDDRATAVVEGVRDHLRVLLVSGEPHVGERAWRDLLKSDAAVDLVHFTILRPIEKQDGTPTDEMALIAFPTRELFQDRIDKFDLIVFDRWNRRSILPAIYLDNIARRVRAGGAVLVAAGADLAGSGSLFSTPLADVLPGETTGETPEGPFLPRLSPLGNRHPVTRDLPGGNSEPPAWSRWFRLAGLVPSADSQVLMTGPDGRPLLVVARRGEGRVALLTSDQIWLWARGFEGGGPQAALLRRLAHWLMRQPDLEEEALGLSRRGNDIVVERRSLAATVPPVTITAPDGVERRLDLVEAEPGRFLATLPADRQGLWRATDGTLAARLAIGPANPLEFTDLLSTEAKLADLAAATGGSVRRLHDGRAVTVPRVIAREAGSVMSGPDWIGLTASRAFVLEGRERTALVSGLPAVMLVLGLFAAAWWREGRGGGPLGGRV
jgi:hypothetical protein